MKHRNRQAAWCFIIGVATLLPAARGYGDSLPMGKTMELAYSVPDGWNYRRFDGTMQITAPGIALVLKQLPLKDPAKFSTQAALEELFQSLVQPFVKPSVEKKVNLVAMKNTPGCYASFTDASLVGKPDQPDNYKIATVGLLKYGKAIVQFSLMSNATDSKRYAEAMSVITSLKYRKISRGPTAVDVPGEDWAISFKAPSFSEVRGETTRRGYSFFGTSRDGFHVSIFVEKKEDGASGNQACADFYWPRAKRNPKIDPSTVEIQTEKKFVKVSYRIRRKTPGMEIDIPNINLYFEYKGKWIDVHVSVSKFPLEASDRKKLDAFVSSLTYGPVPKPADPS